MKIDLVEAIENLEDGNVVAIPTETVYGLAARYDLPMAVNEIFSIKQRPKDHPLIIHVDSFETVKKLTHDITDVAEKLANAYWPGPLTIILPRSSRVSDLITAGQDSVALRMPNHQIALSLIKAVGPLVAPSANKFTQLSPTSADEVESSLGQNIRVLDGGRCNVGIESTIVSLLNPERLSILRPGIIGSQELASVSGLPCDVGFLDKTNLLKVPGNHFLHYAPKKPLYLFEHENITGLEKYLKQHKEVKQIILPTEPAICANQLYALLRNGDASFAKSLCVILPPPIEQWFAIRDRLLKAGQLIME